MKFELSFETYVQTVIGLLGQKFVLGCEIILSDKVYAPSFYGTRILSIDRSPYIRIKLENWDYEFDMSFIKERFKKEYPIEYTVVDMIGIINESFLRRLYR